MIQKVVLNARREWNAPGHQLTGSSWHDPEDQKNSALALDYKTDYMRGMLIGVVYDKARDLVDIVIIPELRRSKLFLRLS